MANFGGTRAAELAITQEVGLTGQYGKPGQAGGFGIRFCLFYRYAADPRFRLSFNYDSSPDTYAVNVCFDSKEDPASNECLIYAADRGLDNLASDVQKCTRAIQVAATGLGGAVPIIPFIPDSPAAPPVFPEPVAEIGSSSGGSGGLALLGVLGLVALAVGLSRK